MTSKPRSQIFDADESNVIHCTVKTSWRVRGLVDPKTKGQRNKARQKRLKKRRREAREQAGIDDSVAREFLSRQAYDQRCDWIQQLIERLAALFAVEVVSFAILEDHVHFILRNRPDCAARLTPEEAVRRWKNITRLKRRGDFDGAAPEEQEIEAVTKNAQELAEVRRNLGHISWFMGTFAEHVSRRINRETPGKQGSSWLGRYFSRVLEDDEAILTCGLYVDLNATRAELTDVPEGYRYSSIGLRMLAYARARAGEELGPLASLLNQVECLSGCPGKASKDAGFLSEFTLDQSRPVSDAAHYASASGRRLSDKGAFCSTFERYLELLDFVGRIVRADKPGAIPADAPAVCERMNWNVQALVETVSNFERLFSTSASCRAALAAGGATSSAPA